MQGDLISRSALLEIFNHDLKCFKTNGKSEAEMYISVADMRKMIEEQPTAYDVEKVMAELKEKSFSLYSDKTKGTKFLWQKDAIDIVRNGGKE